MNFFFLKKYDIFYVHIYKKNIYTNDFKFINVLDVSEFLENLVFNLRKNKYYDRNPEAVCVVRKWPWDKH